MSSTTRRRKREIKRPTVSPLRYPGGKASLYSQLKDIIRTNDLTSATYVEPYAGGAGAALGLLVTGQVAQIVINDLDPAVHAFWMATLNHADEFSDLIATIDLTVEEWTRQKQIYTEAPRDDFLSLGFATFYLNRTNRSGVLNGGPIGGMDQSGNYKIDARFNRDALIERIRLIDLYRNRITVSKRDGLAVIEEYAQAENVFIYADPPYFEKAGTLYMNSFTETHHAALADSLNRHKDAKWLLTYDNVPQVKSLYSDRRQEVFTLSYSAHRVVKAKEIMVFSDALKLPS